MTIENKNKYVSLDADESIFFSRELEAVKSRSYDVEYPELKARRLIPVDTEANAGARSIVYQQYDQVGMAKIIANYADDAPRADVKGKEFTVAVKDLGASYGYNLKEVRAARMAGKPLEQRRANAARRAVLQKENNIAFFGDAETGLRGLLNHPNILEYTLPNDGSGSSKLWSSKTADQILRDMNNTANNIVEQTKGVETPDTLLLPVNQYTFIASTPRSSTSDTTILEYFLRNNPFINNVEWVNELDSAGAGGVDRMVAYKRSPDKVTLDVPSDFEQLPPQERNFEFVVPCTSSLAGVILYYPLSVCFADGL